MNERYGEALDQTLEGELLEFQEASEDMVLKRAADKALLFASRVNKSEFSAEEVDAKAEELNLEIVHALGSEATISGEIITGNDIFDRAEVEDAWAQFHGIYFTLSDEGQLKVRYHLVVVSSDDESSFLTESDLQSRGEAKYVAEVAAADIDKVSVDIKAVHPARARAWLDMAAPEFSREIDDRLLTEEGDEQELLNLSSLKLPVAQKSDGYYEKMLRISTYEYVRAITTVDTEAPYLITLKGLFWDTESGEPVELDASEDSVDQHLFSVSGLTCCLSTEDPDEVEFCLEGSILQGDSTESSIEVLVPLASIGLLKSVRSLVG